MGTDGTVEIRVEQRCWALLPDDQVPVGEDVLYLARAILE